jgi:glutamate racemase
VYYRGDTAQFPYGEKTEAELVPLVLADINSLVKSGCSIVGIACNTASIIWRMMVAQLPVSSQHKAQTCIVDTISTTIKKVQELDQHKTIGIIGTSFTVNSGMYAQAILSQFPDSKPIILQSAEQTLVDAIEKGDQSAIKKELTRITDHFSSYDLDIFILGCTHYGHIAPALQAALPKGVTILNPSILLGRSLFQLAQSIEKIPISKNKNASTPRTILQFTGTTPASCVY